MKRNILFLILFLVSIIHISAHYKRKTKSENEKNFSVTITQNGQEQVNSNNIVTINKDTFDIVFKFSEPMGILVNASFDKKTFKLASKNKHLDLLHGFQSTGMSEGLFNTDREIFISENAPNYWYYETDEENRFNRSEKNNNEIICKRTIENIFEPDLGTKIKVTEVNSPLFLVFISYKRGEKITDRIEVQRQCIMIKWKE